MCCFVHALLHTLDYVDARYMYMYPLTSPSCVDCPRYLGNMETIDFEHFHGLYAKVTEDFTKLCHEWEEKSNKLEEEYSSNQSDEDDIKIEDGRQSQKIFCFIHTDIHVLLV